MACIILKARKFACLYVDYHDKKYPTSSFKHQICLLIAYCTDRQSHFIFKILVEMNSRKFKITSNRYSSVKLFRFVIFN